MSFGRNGLLNPGPCCRLRLTRGVKKEQLFLNLKKELQLRRLISKKAKAEEARLGAELDTATLALEAERAATLQKFHKLVVDLLEARGQLTVRGLIGRAPCSAGPGWTDVRP